MGTFLATDPIGLDRPTGCEPWFDDEPETFLCFSCNDAEVKERGDECATCRLHAVMYAPE